MKLESYVCARYTEHNDITFVTLSQIISDKPFSTCGHECYSSCWRFLLNQHITSIEPHVDVVTQEVPGVLHQHITMCFLSCLIGREYPLAYIGRVELGKEISQSSRVIIHHLMSALLIPIAILFFLVCVIASVYPEMYGYNCYRNMAKIAFLLAKEYAHFDVFYSDLGVGWRMLNHGSIIVNQRFYIINQTCIFHKGEGL